MDEDLHVICACPRLDGYLGQLSSCTGTSIYATAPLRIEMRNTQTSSSIMSSSMVCAFEQAAHRITTPSIDSIIHYNGFDYAEFSILCCILTMFFECRVRRTVRYSIGYKAFAFALHSFDEPRWDTSTYGSLLGDWKEYSCTSCSVLPT